MLSTYNKWCVYIVEVKLFDSTMKIYMKKYWYKYSNLLLIDVSSITWGRRD